MSSLWNTFKSYINWKSKETDEEISQVTTLRVVPLPDFVVYPTNATDRTNNNSIVFFKTHILAKRKSESVHLYELYDNPAMEACIDFKWRTNDNYAKFNYYDHISEILFVYLGYYLLAMEVVQLNHERYKYFCIYNFFDLSSIILAVVASISPNILDYDDEKHILWEDPTQLPNGDTYNITFSSIPGLVDTKIEQVFELDKPIENYYKEWNFWPIHVISTGASILTVIIMQNLLIAFMTGVYENAKYNVIFSVLGYRADLIADYEMLNKPFGSYRGNPRYIYYVRSSEYQDEWMDKAENYRKTH
ncbi:18582_t:CDS:2, partial [Funneliformis geosporum]